MLISGVFFMKQISILLLKIVVWIIGLTVFSLCVFWLPLQANYFAVMFPEFSQMKYPVLIGIYITAVPFFLALYQAYKLLKYIDKNEAFSEFSITTLIYIKYCAITISSLYVVGMIVLSFVNAVNPGIVLLGIMITFISIVIALFAAVLQKLVVKAMDIKLENELTV